MHISDLQDAARRAEERRDSPHHFTRTDPRGAEHYRYSGTPAGMQCGNCGRSIFLLGGRVAGSAADTSCQR